MRRQNLLSVVAYAVLNGFFGSFSFIKALSILRNLVPIPQLPGFWMFAGGGFGLLVATLIVYHDIVTTHHLHGSSTDNRQFARS